MTDNCDEYGPKLKGVGIALIILGSLGIIFDIASIGVWLSALLVINNAPGIYTGIIAIVAGSLNLSVSRNATSCNVTTGYIFALLLCFPSAYMIYWEVTAVLLAQSVGIGAVGSHALAVIDGIGIFISACVASFFYHKARSAGLGS